MAYQPKSYRKFVATAATATLVASAIAPAAMASSHFEDVAPKYKDAVDYLVNNGISQGTTESTFGTHENIKRGDLAIWLAKALKLDTASAPASGFEDTAGTRYDAYVSVLKSKGYISGKSTTEFAPNATVTRGEMAIMLSNAYDLKSDVATSFTDAVGNYKTAIQGLYAYEVTSGKTETTFGTSQNITRGDLAIFLKRAAEVVKTPQVVSVSAVNAKQIEVTFNKAIDSTSILDIDGTLKAGVFTVSTISGNAAVVSDSSVATLSADGKTLTISTSSSTFAGEYVLKTTLNTLKDQQGNFLPVYTSSVFKAEDKVAPTVVSTTKLSANVTRVQFSEPLTNEGSWSFTQSGGSSAIVNVDATNIAKGYVDLTINDSTVTAGEAVVATVIGARDFALNLANPNPFTVNFSKGSADGIKPVISSITPLGLNKFEVKFSEEVMNFDATDISIDGIVRIADAGVVGTVEGTEAIITKDSTDKTKYVVEVLPQTAGYHTVAIAADGVTDLSGELNTAYSRIVTFSADTTAPKLVKNEVKKATDGFEYLHLTFDEAVTLNAINALTATEVKNFVTTNGTIDLTGLTAVSADNKEYKVKLADVEFDTDSTTPVALSNGGVYTVALGGSVDDGANNLAATSITFARGTDAPTVDQTVSSVSSVEGSPSKVKVLFGQALDGTSATNVANYSVSGTVVEKAEILAADGGQTVTLTLKSGTNTLTGARNITIAGVKTKDGKALATPYTGTVSLVENVDPTYTASLVTVADGADADVTPELYVKLTFSEYIGDSVLLDAIEAADFKVTYNGTDLGDGFEGVFASTADAAIASGTAYNTLYLKLDETAVTDISKAVVVSVLASDIVDVIATTDDTALVAADIKGNVVVSGNVQAQ